MLPLPSPDAPLATVEAYLAQSMPFSLADGLTLARHPALFRGWAAKDPSVRQVTQPSRAPALVRAAGRLDLPAVARLLSSPTVSVNARHGPAHKRAYSALAAALSPQPMQSQHQSSWSIPWTASQGAAQEVIVGLLLAAGATIDDGAWSLSVNNLFLGLTDEADVNPRLVHRLLATGQPVPCRLNWSDWSDSKTSRSDKTERPDDPQGRGDPTLLHVMAPRRTPWPEGLVEQMVARGVPVHALNEVGNTALHEIAGAWRVLEPLPFVAALLACGARWDVHNDGGDAPHHTAAFMGHRQVLEALLNAGVPVDLPTTALPVTRASVQPKTSTSGVPDPKSIVVVQGTALHRASQGRTGPLAVETVDLLLTRGADVNARDRHGHTPLHVACNHERNDVAHRLLQAGADPWAVNAQGKTPQDMVSPVPDLSLDDEDERLVGHSGYPSLPALFEGLALRRFAQSVLVDVPVAPTPRRRL